MPELKVIPYQGERKINAIKALREIAHPLGLKEAKDLVERGGYVTINAGIDLFAVRQRMREVGIETQTTDTSRRFDEIAAQEDPLIRIALWADAICDAAQSVLVAQPRHMTERAEVLDAYVSSGRSLIMSAILEAKHKEKEDA